jgi:tetratricopeptide (TPR) repeat protein
MENAESSAVVHAVTAGSMPFVLPPDAVVPRQLPAAVGNFSGRSEELAELEMLAGSGAVVISALNGTAGVGKTALALHWAHRAAERFPHGQLYVNMRGFEPDREPMSPGEAVRGFLDALGVPSDAIPIGQDAQAALFRSEIAQRRVLIVLDNVNNVEQVRPLLPGNPTCFVLITSRNRLSGLVAEHNARPLRLDRLSTPEAVALLRSRIGDLDSAALAEIAELCAGLPLALAIVASRIALEPHLPISAVVSELRGDRLEALELSEGERGARTVFSWSVRALREPAARLFRLLGLHPGPDIDTHAAAALAGIGVAGSRKLLRELASASLLDEYLSGRFRLHDLLRLYARELAGPDDDAQRRMLGFYLHTAWAADRALVSQRIGVGLPELDSVVVPLTFDDPATAGAWFASEHAVLTGLAGHAAAAGLDHHSWQLALTMRSYLDTQGHWRDYEAVYRAAVEAVDRLGDPFAQTRIHRGLGRALSRLREWEEAERMLFRALKFAEEAGDRRQQAHCQEALSWLCSERLMHEEALLYAVMALRLHPEDDATAWRGYALNMAGRCFAAMNELDEALPFTLEALELHRELGDFDKTGEAEALNTLSYIAFKQRSYGEALESAESALLLHRRLDNLPGQAEALERIGDVHLAIEERDLARAAWRQAVAILEHLQRATLPDVRRKLAALG